MDKLNSEVFSSSLLGFDRLNFEAKPKLIVNIPDQTKIKGNYVLDFIQ